MKRLALALSVALTACGSSSGVTRIVDGRVLEGRYIEPEAYAAFLRGAVHEERGELREAILAYGEASRWDEQDPEIHTRLGHVICKLDPRHADADKSIARALSLDPSYAPAWGARASCAALRGDAQLAQEAARKAAALEPQSYELQLLASRLEQKDPGAAHARILALTVEAEAQPAAWEALAAWARAHGEIRLYVRALVELARRAPLRRREVVQAAAALSGEGELFAARTVSGAIADTRDGYALGHALVARLAVDDALARGDAAVARARASRGRVPLDELAARAAMLGQAGLAKSIAEEVLASDPRATGARLVLASTGHGPAAFTGVARGPAHVPGAAIVLYAGALSFSTDDARAVTSAIEHEPIVAGDTLVVARAVDLAARGGLAESELPLDGAVELAARKGEPPPASAMDQPGGLDRRHEYLAWAWARPDAARAQQLARALAPRRAGDPIVLAAWARLVVAGKAPLGPGESAGWVLERGAGHPIALAAAIDLASREKDLTTLERAKKSLAALALTPAERRSSAE